MLTADINLNEFNRRMAGLVSTLKLDSKKVMHKELGELIKTLVKVSPPRDRNKSMAAIKGKVNFRFEAFRNQNNLFASDSAKVGPSGLKFWGSNSKMLFGGAPDMDGKKKSTNELRAVFYKSRKRSGSYRLVLPFLKPRPSGQRVAITTRIMTKQSQINALGKKMAGNFGRLKAGFMAAAKQGVVTLSGQFAPPPWVKKHVNSGLRGGFINGLATPDNPHFTIINRAKGVTERASTFYIGLAMRIRAKAMKSNLERIMEGRLSGKGPQSYNY